MPKEKSLNELKAIYHEVRSKFEETNQNAIRDKRSDYPMLSPDELSEILNSNISKWRKIKLLHTQIGYLRINMFHEYYEQIIALQQKNELHKAAKLMSKYAESIAIPFVPIKRQTLVKWLRKMFHFSEPIEPSETIHNWRACYQLWLKANDPSHPRKNDQERNEKFQKLFTVFLTLYTYSFTVSNFPPLGQRRTDR